MTHTTKEHTAILKMPYRIMCNSLTDAAWAGMYVTLLKKEVA